MTGTTPDPPSHRQGRHPEDFDGLDLGEALEGEGLEEEPFVFNRAEYNPEQLGDVRAARPIFVSIANPRPIRWRVRRAFCKHRG